MLPGAEDYSPAGALSVAGTDYNADAMSGSPDGNATGTLVDCGLGDSTCSGVADSLCLISRGDVSFADKVLNCEAGGGIGAIIYNNVSGPLLGTLGDTVTSIPSIGVSQADGTQLRGELDSSASVTVSSSEPYVRLDGTSMATPHVSGVAALVWSHFPTASNEEIRDALASSALDVNGDGRDNYFGYGIVQAYAALVALGGAGSECSSDADCDDGNVCNGDETCLSGSCASGSALSCDDGNECTDDTCDAALGCQSTAVADGTSCADSDICNGDEVCTAGSCGAAGVASAGTACSDGDACNGDETCDGSGSCVAGSALQCGADEICDSQDGCVSAPSCKASGDKCKSNSECCSGACYIGGGRPRCG
jgi:hypothetical protein